MSAVSARLPDAVSRLHVRHNRRAERSTVIGTLARKATYPSLYRGFHPHNANARGRSLHRDPIQSCQERDEGIGITRIEHTADRKRAQRRVLDLDGNVPIAVELRRHFTQRPMIKYDLVLQPRERLRQVDRRRLSGHASRVNTHLITCIDALHISRGAATLVPEPRRVAREHGDLALRDRNDSDVGLSINDEFGTDGHRHGSDCDYAKPPATVMRHLEQYLSLVELDDALMARVTHSYRRVRVEVQHRPVLKPLHTLLAACSLVGLSAKQQAAIHQPENPHDQQEQRRSERAG